MGFLQSGFFSGVCNVQMTANARRKIVICESPFCPVSLRRHEDGARVLSKGDELMSFFKSELPKYIHHDLKNTREKMRAKRAIMPKII